MVLRPKSLFQSDTFFPEGSKERLFSCFLQFQALEAAYIQAPSCLEPAGAMRVFTPQFLWWWLFFCLLACTRTPCYFPRTFLICAQNDPTLTALKTRLWEPGAERLAVKENPLLTHFLAPASLSLPSWWHCDSTLSPGPSTLYVCVPVFLSEQQSLA